MGFSIQQPARQSQPLIQPDGNESDKNIQTPNASYSSGKGGNVTYSATSGQPKTGSPNQYSNTIGQWDNASIQPQSLFGGKGKGF